MKTSSVRIAFVSGNLNLGGSTTFLINVAGELVRRGVPVHVSSFKSSPLATEFERQNIPVFIESGGRRIYEDRLAACLGALRDFQPTLVVGCLAPPSFEILRYVPEGICKVGMVQSDDPGVYRALGVYRAYLDAAVGVSKTITSYLRQQTPFSDLRSEYIPYGVPMPSHLPVREEQADAPLRIIYLGRLDEDQKRVRLFPKIYRQLCDSGIPFSWTLAGDGPERAYLESAMVGGNPDQKVIFAGQVDYTAVPQLLEQQDVFLLTSTFEGLPLSLLEAMGNGLVPVVSDLKSGIREIVDETNGLLVPVDRVEGYAEALISLYRNRTGLAHRRVEARSSVYPAFSINAMANRWLELASSLASSSAPWPAKQRIHRPFECKPEIFYSKPGRWIRRLARALRR